MIGNTTVGSQQLLSFFLMGVNRLQPIVNPRVLAWDLSQVLDVLSSPTFEPLAQAELKWLSIRTAFLMAVKLAKQVGEIHALCISEFCLQ